MTTTKVCLVNPPQFNSLDDRIDPPLGLMYIASTLERNNVPVSICDLANRKKEDWPNLIDYADVYGITVFSASLNVSRDIARTMRQINPNAKIVVGGPHPTSLPKETVAYPEFDHVVVREGEEKFLELVRNVDKGIPNDKIIYADQIKDVDAIPLPARHLLDMKGYSREVEGRKATSLLTARGCPFSCLTGDTIVNTLDGDIPIKDLVGKKDIKVFTFDQKTEQVFITDAINCQKTKENVDIVRVLFDDETHIDCTPDHKFLVFKNGNQFKDIERWEVEAKDLTKGMRMHAIRFTKNFGYTDVSWARRKRMKLQRMVMEYKLGRKLKKQEQVHHIDRNKSNNQIDNLILFSNDSKHKEEHYTEISTRMKEYNPTKHMTKEWINNIKKATTGQIRSLDSRKRYRLSKLGKKNPNYKDGNRMGESSRLDYINHKIVSVTPIGKADVYDLEVPSTHWYYANNVLVHNCSFCCKDIHGRKVRYRSVESIIDEVDSIKRDYGIDSFIIYDDIFTLNRTRLKKLTDAFKERNITYRCNGHAGTNTFEDFVALKESGCQEIAFGIESGSDKILKLINKGTTVQSNYDTIVTAKRAGLLTKAYLVVGFPGETQETIDETKKFMDEAYPDKFTLFQFVPLPGCDVYRNPTKYGVTSMNKDWDQFYNIAGQYQGGQSFETKELTPERAKYLHDDLLKHLLNRKGNDHGQHGTLQGYYKNLKL